ncbi:hypothetical protein [Amycolatopsis methanolica]|uniref:Uncharacterized protein n=1 Tax=Amycolatopsis methanolica 239 TaxID=1068978 RepID=A0A076N0P5_AMYME|nr:hypothetical protein [Amycolatopsis methanolica]AIJ26359.1 hypothetical protein AMETH_6267 [Amycolatopsis methanolica 239]AIJ26418.1 hypothetical protein AMETH_6326 [Amycolatopsis methanolica 239]
MLVTYTPQGQETQSWTWDPAKVRAADAEAIEARMHPLTWDEFQVMLLKGGAKARRVLLWHLQKLTHPTLKLEDVDFTVGELTVEFEAPELEKMREAAASAPGLDDSQRAYILSAIDAQIAKAPESAAGKAPSSSGAKSTP